MQETKQANRRKLYTFLGVVGGIASVVLALLTVYLSTLQSLAPETLFGGALGILLWLVALLPALLAVWLALYAIGRIGKRLKLWPTKASPPIADIAPPVLPPIEDPTDQRIFDLFSKDPDITQKQIGQQINLGRQAVNTRVAKLRAMGYLKK